VLIPDEKAMLDFARRLAAKARVGDVIRLIGGLGAGKTTFARGFIAASGFSGPVTSPTFTLIQEYPTNPPVCHVDLYRLENIADINALGLDDYSRSHVMLVEWADKANETLPKGGCTIRFEIVPEGRLVTVEESAQ
jgi:tRNA threonylcarbamoyladenosine biosynthesis protein TsaE